MREIPKVTNDRRFIVSVIILLSSFMMDGCGGSHAEYAPSNHPWVGKCTSFTEPMVYLTNLSADFDREEIVRIGRILTRATFADYLRKIPKGKDLVITSVPLGTTFEVTAVFMIVHEGYSRMFVDDVEIAVLRDSHGHVSTIGLNELERCNK